MVVDKTLYDKLEIDPNISQDEIKKRGKKLLVKWHPDKHPDNVEVATKKFQELQEALSILDNPEKRKIYDEYGMDGIKGDMPGGPGGNPFGQGFPFGGGFPFENMFGGFPGGQFQGGGFPGAQFNVFPQREERKENVMEKLNVTLKQIFKEETVDLKYKHKICCVKCNGEGSNDGTKTDCNDCGGKGVRQQVIKMGPIIQQSIVPCNGCKGKGKKIPEQNKCDNCNGSGTLEKEKTIPIPLKNGLINGVKLQLEGKGHNLKNSKSDLIVVIEVEEDSEFKRSGADLVIEIELKLYQALFGFNKIIEHLDGRKLLLQHSGKTEFGTVRKISGEGMRDLRTGIKGDLVIKFNINLPTISNETLIRALTLMDKSESKKEKAILIEENLVKTIMTDISTYKSTKNINDSSDEESGNENNFNEGPSECRQQ